MSEGVHDSCENCGRRIRPGQVLCSDCKHIEESEDDRKEDYDKK